MKTAKQRNMTKREIQTLFHTIVNATKQAAEETRKELAPMKKALTDIDGGIHRRQDGQLRIGNKVVRLDANGKTLSVDDTGYSSHLVCSC